MAAAAAKPAGATMATSRGGVPERSKGAGCKPICSAYVAARVKPCLPREPPSSVAYGASAPSRTERSPPRRRNRPALQWLLPGVCPSGQRERAVNPSAQPTEVRILPPPPRVPGRRPAGRRSPTSGRRLTPGPRGRSAQAGGARRSRVPPTSRPSCSRAASWAALGRSPAPPKWLRRRSCTRKRRSDARRGRTARQESSLTSSASPLEVFAHGSSGFGSSSPPCVGPPGTSSLQETNAAATASRPPASTCRGRGNPRAALEVRSHR